MSQRNVLIYKDPFTPPVRSVTLSLDENDRLRLYTLDVGASVEAAWGSSDYEFWLDIEAPQLPALHAALLADSGGEAKSHDEGTDDTIAERCFDILVKRYTGEARATDGLHEFCKANAIKCRWSRWV
ncbi:hypothetical protein [Erythrobacter sp. KY5]|uniref:hypothetical protein n=1 Tax=Erythrobacter sp. KY5 TaxID=2011159 RepID=UPI0013A6B1AF|nr:hypothetical protein [Erythrobacter sp. KY5]